MTYLRIFSCFNVFINCTSLSMLFLLARYLFLFKTITFPMPLWTTCDIKKTKNKLKRLQNYHSLKHKNVSKIASQRKFEIWMGTCLLMQLQTWFLLEILLFLLMYFACVNNWSKSKSPPASTTTFHIFAKLTKFKP